jgi:hypothetical protein
MERIYIKVLSRLKETADIRQELNALEVSFVGLEQEIDEVVNDLKQRHDETEEKEREKTYGSAV